MNSTLPNTIEREITIRAPRERVYTAITDPKQIVAWFPDGIEGSLEPGERPVFDFGEYGKFQIYVVDAQPHSYFAYRWVSGSSYIPHGFQGDVLEHPNTLVEFLLEEVAEGTKVKLVETGFASLPAEIAAQTLKDNAGGWAFMLETREAHDRSLMAVAEIFKALGDPVRLEMVQRLTRGSSCTIASVSADLGITRQGARKHLQVLVDAKVVALEPKGRDVIVQLDPEALDQAKLFIAELERRWDTRLEALRRFVEES